MSWWTEQKREITLCTKKKVTSDAHLEQLHQIVELAMDVPTNLSVCVSSYKKSTSKDIKSVSNNMITFSI